MAAPAPAPQPAPASPPSRPANRRPDPGPLGPLSPEEADENLLTAEVALLARWLGEGATAADLAALALSRARATLQGARAGHAPRAEGDRANALLLANRAGHLEALCARALAEPLPSEVRRLAAWRSVVPAAKDRAAVDSLCAFAAREMAPLLREWNGLADQATALRRSLKGAEAQLLSLTERALSEKDEGWARRWRSEAVQARARLKGERARLRELGETARTLRGRLPSPEALAAGWMRAASASPEAAATAAVVLEHAIRWLWDDTPPQRWLSRCGHTPATPAEPEETSPIKRWRVATDMTFLGAARLPAGTIVEEIRLEEMEAGERAAWKASKKTRDDQRLAARQAWEKATLEALPAEQRADLARREPLWEEAGEAGERSREKWLRAAAKALKLPRLVEAPKVIPFRWEGGLRYGEVGREVVAEAEEALPEPPSPTLPPPLSPAAAEAEARIRAAMEGGDHG